MPKQLQNFTKVILWCFETTQHSLSITPYDNATQLTSAANYSTNSNSLANPLLTPANQTSPLGHLSSICPQIKSEIMSPHPLPDHYYERDCVFLTSKMNESSSSYLKPKKRDSIKLLRKVDDARWIAKIEDRIDL